MAYDPIFFLLACIQQHVYINRYYISQPSNNSTNILPNSCWPQVYTFKWHMGHYGSDTPKPEKGWTNHAKFAEIRKGKWSYKNNSSSSGVKTVQKTISKTTGKSSYSGTPALKKSQSGAYLPTYINELFILVMHLLCPYSKHIHAHARVQVMTKACPSNFQPSTFSGPGSIPRALLKKFDAYTQELWLGERACRRLIRQLHQKLNFQRCLFPHGKRPS